MRDNKIVIFGASHTGIALTKKIGKGCILVDAECSDPEVAAFFFSQPSVNVGAFDSDSTFFVLHDEDSANVSIILLIKNIYPHAQVYTVLSQPNLGAKLKKHVTKLEYVNQAELAAKKFVDSIYDSDVKTNMEPEVFAFKTSFRMDPLIKRAMMFIFGLMAFSTIFFHLHDDLRWIDSWYFTITMMTTTGFGDYNLQNHGDFAKIVGTVVMICSVIGFSLVFALINDTMLRKRRELTHGVSRYRGKDHVVVIGGGSVGSKVIQELLKRNEKPILIDKNVDGRYVKDILDSKIPFIIGDATNEKILVDANIKDCKAVIAVTQHDLVNIEVGLDAKSLFPDKTVVLRIYDQKLSSSLKDNKIIKHSYSMSSIAADYFLQKIK